MNDTVPYNTRRMSHRKLMANYVSDVVINATLKRNYHRRQLSQSCLALCVATAEGLSTCYFCACVAGLVDLRLIPSHVRLLSHAT